MMDIKVLLHTQKNLFYQMENVLIKISTKTAAVIIEPIQGATGCIMPKDDFLKKVRDRCSKTNTLLIFDEIQTCFGRIGTIFALEHYNVIPDILCIAKGMGGCMPIGAFISSKKLMNLLTVNPQLGHITTFGGHPINCAASKATLNYLLSSKILDNINKKEMLFRTHLKHSKIHEIRGKGV